MKQNRSSKRSSRPAKSIGLALSAITLLALCTRSAQAATYYWDEDDATAGFGTAGTSPTTWSSTTSLFSTSSAGTAAVSGTQATAFGDQATFATDAAALGSGTITVSGIVDITTIRMGRLAGQGPITLSGGTINFAATGTIIGGNAASLTINSALTGAATALNFTNGGAAGGIINLGGGYTGGGTLANTGGNTVINLTAGTYTVANATSGNSSARHLNLNGGTLQTAGNVFASGAAGQLSFDGGTLRSNNGAGITVVDFDNNIVVNAGGAIFDTTVGSITIGSNGGPVGTLSGTGTITVVGGTGTTFSVNNLNVADGTPLGFDLGGVSIDNAVALVSLTTFTETLDGGTYNVDFNGFDFSATGAYKLVGFSSISGTLFDTDFVATNSTVGPGFNAGFVIDGDSLSYVVSAIPEPSAFAAFAGLIALGFAASRRRAA